MKVIVVLPEPADALLVEDMDEEDAEDIELDIDVLPPGELIDPDEAEPEEPDPQAAVTRPTAVRPAASARRRRTREPCAVAGSAHPVCGRVSPGRLKRRDELTERGGLRLRARVMSAALRGG